MDQRPHSERGESGAESTDQFANVAGSRVRYRVSGTGPAVVLLHGIGRSLEDWDAAAPLLATDHTVYTMDLAGFGYSDPPPPGSDVLTALATTTWGLLDAVGELRTIVLVGNSLGGAVALQAAVLRPHRVGALILANSAGFGRTVTPALRLLAIPLVGRALLKPSHTLARRTVQGIVYDQSFVTDERVELAVTLASRPGAARTMLAVVRSLGTWRGIRPVWRRALLERVRQLGIPTLVIWGKQDRILPASHAASVATDLPAAKVILLEDTGHMPQIERPTEFAHLVTEFLDKKDQP